MEWLRLLAGAGCRVPEKDLTHLLERAVKDEHVRAALAPVLGERGRWLAGHHPRWSVVLSHPASLPPDADLHQVWEAGSPPERHAALARLRTTDPAAGREMLATTWQKGRAEDRRALVALLGEELGQDDEALLLAALQDRSDAVRQVAAGLLRRLPGSDLGRRALVRARVAVRFERHPEHGSALVVEPPTAFDASMEADAMSRDPVEGRVDPRAWWLTQVVSAVPLDHWTDLVADAPDRLLFSLPVTRPWREAVISGWRRAVHAQREEAWVEALLRREQHPHAQRALVDRLEPARREHLAAAVYAGTTIFPRAVGSAVVSGAEPPWGTDLVRAALRWLADPGPALGPDGAVDVYQRFAGDDAARGLPVHVLPMVRAVARHHRAGSPRRRLLDEAVAVLTTRTEMLEELS